MILDMSRTGALIILLLCPVLAGAQAPDTTIVIRASSGALEFVPAEIAVKQGTRVRIQFINAGILPHNIVFVRDDDDIDAMAAAAMREGGDYVPLAMKEKMLGYTRLASPAQTVEVIFVVPPPGQYTYVCLMSGHAGMMLGTLRSLR